MKKPHEATCSLTKLAVNRFERGSAVFQNKYQLVATRVISLFLADGIEHRIELPVEREGELGVIAPSIKFANSIGDFNVSDVDAASLGVLKLASRLKKQDQSFLRNLASFLICKEDVKVLSSEFRRLRFDKTSRNKIWSQMSRLRLPSEGFPLFLPPGGYSCMLGAFREEVSRSQRARAPIAQFKAIENLERLLDIYAKSWEFVVTLE
jgi:hypothetical protein